MITYDENEWLTDVDDNRIYTVLLGRGVTANRTDDTRYSHYSAISFLQKTWGLGSLGSDDDDAVPLALVK